MSTTAPPEMAIAINDTKKTTRESFSSISFHATSGSGDFVQIRRRAHNDVRKFVVIVGCRDVLNWVKLSNKYI